MKNESPDRRAVPVVSSVIVVVVGVLLIYVAGYFWLGDAWRPGPAGPGPLRMRVFGSPWLAAAYQPAAWVESRIRGYPVIAGTEDDLRNASP
jgi:hypothetical protein